MFQIADKAKRVQSRLKMFENYPSDHTVVMKKLPALVALIEEIESMAVVCRKAIAGYQKDLPYYQGMAEESGERNAKKISHKMLYGTEKSVTVKVENEILTLILFPLIKNLSAKTKEYLSMLIGNALKEYFKTHRKPDFYTSDCVLVINSLYITPEIIRDNDNVETAAIINAIKTYLLKDDGFGLSIYRMGSISDRYETEIYLMRQSDFILWLHSILGTHQIK